MAWCTKEAEERPELVCWKKTKEPGELHRSDDGLLTHMRGVQEEQINHAIIMHHDASPSRFLSPPPTISLHLLRPLARRRPSLSAPAFLIDYSFSGPFLLEVGGGDS
ncbi:unnamed protein product [Urochloa humidicola]